MKQTPRGAETCRLADCAGSGNDVIDPATDPRLVPNQNVPVDPSLDLVLPTGDEPIAHFDPSLI